MTVKRYIWVVLRTFFFGAGAYLVANYLVNRNANSHDTDSVAVSVGQSSELKTSHDSKAESPETLSLRRDVMDLSKKLRELRKQTMDNQTQIPAVAKKQEKDSEDRLPRTPEAVAENERRWHNHMVTVETGFQGEKKNASWASATSDAIRATFGNDSELTNAIQGVECHSQTCKIEIIDDRSGIIGKKLPPVISKLANELPSTLADHVDLGDGTLLLTIYMTRGRFSD